MLLLTINPSSYKYFSKSIHVKFSLLAPYEEDPSEEMTTGFKSNLLHQVTPVTSEKCRILVTLNYNTEEGIELSENARLTFFGRTK